MAFYKVKYSNSEVTPPFCHSHTINFCGERLILFGGTDGSDYFNDIYSYEIEKNYWIKSTIENKELSPKPRYKHTAEFFSPKYLLIYGGAVGTQIHDSLHILNTKTLTWIDVNTIGSNSPGYRFSHQSFGRGDEMYILFGLINFSFFL